MYIRFTSKTRNNIRTLFSTYGEDDISIIYKKTLPFSVKKMTKISFDRVIGTCPKNEN